jgi:DNA helicase II / ATP-dependent DNA helicase PcrA
MQHLETFFGRYNILNEKQKEAVDTIDGPVLVVAGPGSGKTELLTLRIANILRLTDTEPRSILCLTFTDSAAKNMLDRLTQLIGKDAYKVSIHTFHSFATEIINQNPEYFFSGAVYKPADNLAQYKILNDLFEDLSHNSPFKIYSEDRQFTYLSDVQSSIAALKREGVDPDVFEKILLENKEFLDEIDQTALDIINLPFREVQLADLNNLVQSIEKTSSESDLKSIYLSSTKEIYEQTLELPKKSQSKPFTEWKNRYTKPNDLTGKKEFLDQINQKKHFELAQIYRKYQAALHQQGLFDFDDMLIEVNKAMRNYPGLLYTIQEKFLYVLVDEFQDTNSAQSELLYHVIDNDFSNNEPNVLAVGDDDQAIYKFQGANLQNIISFKEKYPTTKIITLEYNYRSHQSILDLAKSVVEQTHTRLSTKLNFPKPLISGVNQNKILQKPVLKSFETRDQELLYITYKTKELISNGVSPAEIAILSRDHKQLIDLVKVCNQMEIPIRYDRGENVLEQPLVRQIILILRYISTISQSHKREADEFLPNILSFEVFNLNPNTIYKISHIAHKNKINWLDVMGNLEIYNSKNKDTKKEAHTEPFLPEEESKIHEIARFLHDLAKASKNESAEQVLDRILGVSQNEVYFQEDENDDGEAGQTEQYQYYFSFKNWLKNKPEYLSYLSGLKMFVSTLRGYQPKATITIWDILELIDVVEKNHLTIVDNSPYNQSEKAVQLMTAHKAKGLEFEYVFILDSAQSVWAKQGRATKITLPLNLPLQPDKDSDDDHIRLFFVAITRAKNELYLTHFKKNDKNKDVSLLEYIVDVNEIVENTPEPHLDLVIGNTIGVLQTWLLGELKQRILSLDEKEWLRPTLENYKLSVTHLNNFLDVVNGGPEMFLEQNLLKFPKSKNFSAAYGTAVHDAIAQMYREYKGFGVLPGVERVLEYFESTIKNQRLSKIDEQNAIGKGREALAEFYVQKQHEFNLTHDIELDFGNQNVRVGDAHITGKLDQVWYNNDKTEAVVVDLKTGKSFDSWRGGDIDLQKLDRYRRQLVFYRLLVENSRSFGGLKVEQGALLFVEPDKKDRNLVKTLSLEITEQDANEMRKLVRAVWQKIQNLDFPDTSGYEKSNKGIQQFIQDLIEEVD